MGSLANYVYIVSGALFILSLKWMNSPVSARRGVMAGELGMVLAIAGTANAATPEGVKQLRQSLPRCKIDY
jgi:NAD/NADP transhydrogenase beta subunit